MYFDRNMLGKRINIAKNEGPLVSYKYDIIESTLKKYFCVKRREDLILGKVLCQFGYNKDDMIILTNILYKDNEVIIDYLVNGVDTGNKITIKFDNLIYNYRLIVSDNDRVISCQISVFNKRNIDFRISNIKEKLENGNIYEREYNTYYAVYKVVVNNIEVEFNLKTGLFDNYCNENILVLEKEKEIENYIKNIDISKGLEKIYKDIINYIGDIYNHLDIKLSITALNKRIGDNNKLEDVVTDMICVNNGVCEKIMVTRGNKCVSIDKDGSAQCRYNDEFVEIVTLVNEYDSASYNIKSSNEIVLREQVFIHGVQGLEEAIDEIDEVKEKILRLVPNKR